MTERKPIVAGGRGSSAERNAAWARVVRVLSAAMAIVLGAGLYVDGGYAPGAAAGLALAAGIILHTILGGIGPSRGLGFIEAARHPANRMKLASAIGAVCASLAAGGVYFHDGESLGTALLTGAVVGGVGFILGYFPVIGTLLGFLGLFR